MEGVGVGKTDCGFGGRVCGDREFRATREVAELVYAVSLTVVGSIATAVEGETVVGGGEVNAI